jgi:uncharacterized protein
MTTSLSRPRGRRYSPLPRLAMLALDAALLNGLLAKWSYRLGWHGSLGISSHLVELPDDRPLPAPLCVAFASDFHAGPTTHPEVFARLAEELADRRPDVLLLGGDFVSLRAEYMTPLIAALARYTPPLGSFAVLGNHDLWSNHGEITNQLNACGVEVLVNRNVALDKPFECVSICGIDDPWTGDADCVKAFDNAKSVRIWLTHSPDGLLLLHGQQYSVGFAGHTHGGQICLRDGTALDGAGGQLSRSHSRGRFDISGNGPLIVSRGVGCSNLPLRINSDPELIFCELR